MAAEVSDLRESFASELRLHPKIRSSCIDMHGLQGFDVVGKVGMRPHAPPIVTSTLKSSDLHCAALAIGAAAAGSRSITMATNVVGPSLLPAARAASSRRHRSKDGDGRRLP
jgi:hypothetical protein